MDKADRNLRLAYDTIWKDENNKRLATQIILGTMLHI